LPGAHVTYTIRYADGSSQTQTDVADTRGHSLVVFAVSYAPPAGSAHGSPPTVGTITVSAVSADGSARATARLRFAILHGGTS
jgi:hypothetical protein